VAGKSRCKSKTTILETRAWLKICLTELTYLRS
jgi:hypothetical protein